MQDDRAVEEQIVLTNPTAPRLTPRDITSKIEAAHYYIVPDTCTTICTLILQNGFTVTGHSAPVSAANFDAKLGQDIAFSKAAEQIWALEGYLLKQKLYDEAENLRLNQENDDGA